MGNWNPNYFEKKPGSLEEAILNAVNGKINEKLDAVNPKAAKKKFDDRKDKDIDNDGDVDSSDKFLHKRRKAIGKAMQTQGEEVKYPHKMYDPKTGKEVTAKTPEDHEKYNKMGYTHTAPKKEAYEMGTKEYADHTMKVTPGQTTEDWNKQVNMMQEKNNSMRSVLADMWGVNEGKSPFQTEGGHLPGEKKKKKDENKTMTGQPMTKVSIDPDMKEKVKTETSIGKKNVK